MRRATAFFLATLAVATQAQTPAVSPPPPPVIEQAEPADKRPDPRIQRIRHEDAGSQIDELRVGGQTQTISVQPKNGAAGYEVVPQEAARSAPAARTDGTVSGGQRVWNVLNF